MSRRLERHLRIIGALCVFLTVTVTSAGSVAAFDVVLSGVVDRPCGADAPWTGTVTASSNNYGFEWETDYQIDGGPFSPTSARLPDTESFVYPVGPFSASTAQVTVTVGGTWYNDIGTIGASASVVLNRPATTVCPGDVEVTPTAPNVVYDCSEGSLIISGADDTSEVDYTVTTITAPAGEDSSWQVTVTAAPQPGFVFPPGTVSSWDFSGTVDCDETPTEVTPVVPTVVYDCDTGEIVITGADDTDEYTYVLSSTSPPGGEGSFWNIFITATPQPGYVFPPGAVSDWEFFGTVDCIPDDGEVVEVIPVVPTVVYDCEAGEIVITGADDTDEYTYVLSSTSPPGGEGSFWNIFITATAQPGYVFPTGTVSDWDFSGTVDCEEPIIVATPAVPRVGYDCDASDIVVTGAEDTDGVDYTVTVVTAPAGQGSPWQITISATPQPGYVFPPGTVSDWDFSGTAACQATSPLVTPQVGYDCAIDELVITGADDTAEFDFTVVIVAPPGPEESEWIVSIDVVGQPGVLLPPGGATSWNFAGIVDCSATGPPELPPEFPISPAVGFDCDSNDLVITGGVDTESVDYTITVDVEPNGEGSTWSVSAAATARPGFRFVPGATTRWTYSGAVNCGRAGTDTDVGPTGGFPPPPPVNPITNPTPTADTVTGEDMPDTGAAHLVMILVIGFVLVVAGSGALAVSRRGVMV